MSLNAEVLARLTSELGRGERVSGTRSIYRFGRNSINVRSASKKSGDKFWFDVTPSFYEKRLVDYFVYGCGSYNCLYVFPVEAFSLLIHGASLGGQKQVPNFTIYTDRHLLEPAGRASSAHDIRPFHNQFSGLRG